MNYSRREVLLTGSLVTASALAGCSLRPGGTNSDDETEQNVTVSELQPRGESIEVSANSDDSCGAVTSKKLQQAVYDRLSVENLTEVWFRANPPEVEIWIQKDVNGEVVKRTDFSVSEIQDVVPEEIIVMCNGSRKVYETRLAKVTQLSEYQ